MMRMMGMMGVMCMIRTSAAGDGHGTLQTDSDGGQDVVQGGIDETISDTKGAPIYMAKDPVTAGPGPAPEADCKMHEA